MRTILVKRRVERFTPHPENKSIGFIQSIVSDETEQIEGCEESESEQVSVHSDEEIDE